MATLRTGLPWSEVHETMPSSRCGDTAGVHGLDFSRSSPLPARTVCFVKHIREGSAADTESVASATLGDSFPSGSSSRAERVSRSKLETRLRVCAWPVDPHAASVALGRQISLRFGGSRLATPVQAPVNSLNIPASGQLRSKRSPGVVI